MAVKVTVYGTADMSQIDRARAQLDALEKKAQLSAGGFVGSMARIGAGAKSAGDKMAALGSSMTRNLTLPIAAAGVALYKATENAAKDEQAQVVLAKALKNTTGATNDQIASVETWITKQGELLGVTDDQLRPAMATLVGATKDITKAQTLASLAMDIAAAKGVDVETASKAVAKAYAGQTTALARLVPGIDATALKTKDFGAISASVAKIVGGQAATAAGTMAGQMQRNKVAMDESIESLGYAFMPIMQDFSTILRENIVPAIQSVASWFSSLDANTKRNIVNFGLLLAAAGPIVSVLGGVFRGVSSVANGMIGLYNGTSAAIGGLRNLWTGLTNAQAGASAFATPMMQLGGHLRNAATATWQFVTATSASIGAGIKASATWVATTAAMVAHKVATMAGTIATGIATAAQWLWNVAMTANPIGIVVVAIAALIAIIVVLATNVKGIGQFFGQAWEKISSAVTTGIDKVKSFLSGFVSTMATLASNIVDGFLKGLADFGKKAWDAITSPITGAIDGVKNMLGIHSPSQVTNEIGVNIGEGFDRGIKSKAAAIHNTVSRIADDTTNTLNGALANVDRASVVQRLSGDGLLSGLSNANFGINPKQVTDAVMGDPKAWKKVNDALTAVTIKFPTALDAQGIAREPWQRKRALQYKKQLQDLQNEFKALGDENTLQQLALGDQTVKTTDTTVVKIDKSSKKLAEKIKEGARLAKEAMNAWSMDEVVKPITTSFDKMLQAIQSQIEATANFMNNMSILKERGLNAGAFAKILGMGAAQGGGYASALAGSSDAQLAQYNAAYGIEQRLTGILGQQQSGARKVQAVNISPGAINVTINGNADGPTVTGAIDNALNGLVKELRSA